MPGKQIMNCQGFDNDGGSTFFSLILTMMCHWTIRPEKMGTVQGANHSMDAMFLLMQCFDSSSIIWHLEGEKSLLKHRVSNAISKLIKAKNWGRFPQLKNVVTLHPYARYLREINILASALTLIHPVTSTSSQKNVSLSQR
jgi:hypothetical protein